MTVSYHALGDKLSNTDPISNAVLISGLDFQRDGANLLLPGRYPLACIGSYIHESLHHMCFRMPVGGAISYLYHRAFLRAYDCRSIASPLHDEHDVLEDVVRVETILHIMRPLAEGIALFGEFDAWPGESKSLSSVFRNTAISFAAIVPDWEQYRIDNLLCEVLARGRARAATRRRKENLLMQGFTTKNGGYFPGYFLVKNLQLALSEHIGSPLLLDAEFYLHFLVHWFYSDFGLVAALLDETKEMAPFTTEQLEERDSVNAISVAFQRRFAALFTLTADDIARFDGLLASEDGIPFWRSQIGISRDAAQSLEERLTSAINSLIDYTAGDLTDDQRAMRAICHDNFVRRNYLCVGSFDEQIEINAAGRANLARYAHDPEFPVMSFGTSEIDGPYSGRATFDVFQSGQSQKVFFTVYAGGERVLINSVADGFGREREQLLQVDISTATCQAVKAVMRALVDETLGEDSAEDLLRGHYRQQAEENTEAMYRNWCGALMSAIGPEADIAPDAGVLLAMCDQDSGFLRAIAALGCLGSPLLDETDIIGACALAGLTVEQFAGRVEAIERDHNLRLLYPVGQYRVLVI